MTNDSNRRAAALALLLATVPALAPAAPGTLARYGVAVYSDLCLEPHTGDIGGQRITLHRYAEGDSVMYEFTAGALSLPVMGTDVAVDDRRGLLTFNVQEMVNGPSRTVIGRFGQHGRTLTLDGGYCADASLPMRLAKVADFGRPLPACKACPAPAPGAATDDTPPPPLADDADAAPTLEQQEQKNQRQKEQQQGASGPDGAAPVPVTPLPSPAAR